MHVTQLNLCTLCNPGGYFTSVSGSAQTSTYTQPKAHACTYTQTHTNPVFQRAQLPEQHRWRTATWRADPDSPPRQTYYRYIQCMIHRKKTLTAYIRSHKHAHTEKDAVQGETLLSRCLHLKCYGEPSECPKQNHKALPSVSQHYSLPSHWVLCRDLAHPVADRRIRRR